MSSTATAATSGVVGKEDEEKVFLEHLKGEIQDKLQCAQVYDVLFDASYPETEVFKYYKLIGNDMYKNHNTNLNFRCLKMREVTVEHGRMAAELSESGIVEIIRSYFKDVIVFRKMLHDFKQELRKDDMLMVTILKHLETRQEQRESLMRLIQNTHKQIFEQMKNWRINNSTRSKLQKMKLESEANNLLKEAKRLHSLCREVPKHAIGKYADEKMQKEEEQKFEEDLKIEARCTPYQKELERQYHSLINTDRIDAVTGESLGCRLLLLDAIGSFEVFGKHLRQAHATTNRNTRWAAKKEKILGGLTEFTFEVKRVTDKSDDVRLAIDNTYEKVCDLLGKKY